MRQGPALNGSQLSAKTSWNAGQCDSSNPVNSPSCTGFGTFSVVPAGGELKLTYQKVWYMAYINNGLQPDPYRIASGGPVAGMSFTLKRLPALSPHLITTIWPPGTPSWALEGNPYWCQLGLRVTLQPRCGA